MKAVYASDPFSTKLRRYYPWPEYEHFQCKQAARSLVNRRTVDFESARERRNELADIETNSGLVYIGERQWLDCVLSRSDHSYSYDVWIDEAFRSIVFASDYYFGRDDGKPSSVDANFNLGECWHGSSENQQVLWMPEEIEVPRVHVRDVTLTGNSKGPSTEVLMLAFSVLHDLAYSLHEIYHKFSPGLQSSDDSIYLEEIVIRDGVDVAWGVVGNDYTWLEAVEFRGGHVAPCHEH